jgi:8-oxo-dGTP pyrophosphatase MutT (NUDIX family)
MTEVFFQRPEPFAPRVEIAAAYVVCREKLLLLQYREKEGRGALWGVPAGKIEQGESPKEALVRELYEETKIDAREDTLSFLGNLYMRNGCGDYTYHGFYLSLPELENIALSDEHTAFCWVSVEEAKRLPLIGGGLEALSLL